MLLRSVICTAVILAILPTLFPARTTAQTISTSVSEEQDFTFASGLYRDGLYQLAADQFEKFLAKYPTSLRGSDAQFLIAESYFHVAQYQRAAKEYSRFIRAYPQSQMVDDAYFRVGLANLRAKKTEEAIGAFKTVLDKFPASELAGESAYWIGEAYLKDDDDNNAIKYYALAYENYPKNSLRNFSLYSIAWAYQHKEDYTRALEWYNRLIMEFPSDTLSAAAKVHVGECYFYAKEYHQAMSVLKEATGTIGPTEERGEAEYLIAESMYRLGDLPGAQDRYKQFLTEYPGHRLEREVRYALGWCYLQQKSYAEAIRTFKEVEEGNDAIAHASLYRKGTAESLRGNKREALNIFEQVALRDPQGEFSDNALFDAGMICYGEERTDTARACFLRIVKGYPSSDMLAETHRMIGECYVRESKYAEALPWFEKAVSDSSASFDVKVAAMYQAGWCLYKERKYKEASSRFTEFLANYPVHPKAYEAQFWLAESEYQQGNFDSALTAYKNVTAVNGGSKREDALYGVAWSYFKLANYPAAIEGFEKLLAAYPKGKRAFDARNRLGDAYFFEKDYKRAAGSYRVAMRFAADSESVDYASYQLAQSLFRSGDLSASYEQFSDLIRRYPKSQLSDDSQYALGWINFQRKEYSDAIQEFQKIPKIYPQSELVPRALYSLGDSYYNMKQYVAAEKSYREVLRQYPQSPFVADAITGIQYCLTAQGKEPQALEVLDEFIRGNPGTTVAEEIALKKADWLFSQKNYVNAAREYRSLAERYPKSQNAPTAIFKLAACYRVQDNLMESALTFERAASMGGRGSKLAGDALLEASDIYAAQNNRPKARSMLQKIEEDFRDPVVLAEAAYRQGLLLFAEGKSPEAKNRFEALIARSPNLPVADKCRVAVAKISIVGGDFSSAQSLVELVATTQTNELGAEAQFLVGETLAGKKDWKNAIPAYLRVKYVFGAYEKWVARAYLGLGAVYETTQEFRKAKEAYENVIKLNQEEKIVGEAQRRLKSLEQL